MNMKMAFKCKLTPGQEEQLGKAMIEHERGICREYLGDGRGTWLTLPQKTQYQANRIRMMKWMRDFHYGHEFNLDHLLTLSSPDPVYGLARKLCNIGALTDTSRWVTRGKKKTYIVSIPNRVVLERMITNAER